MPSDEENTLLKAQRIFALLQLGLLVGIVVIAYVIISALFFSGNGQSDLARLSKGEMAQLQSLRNPPPLAPSEILDIDNRPHQLATWQGNLLIVNYWATWCPPCLTELPSLGALQKTRQDQGLKVIAISVDRLSDRDFAIETLRETTDGKLDFYHNYDYATAYEARVTGFPTTIIYDRKGQEVARLAGEADWMSDEALKLVEYLLEK